MAHLEVKQLYKIFGPHPDKALAQLKEGVSKQAIMEDSHHTVALQDVSLTITPGETFVVMGLSGSGKSTFVRCLNRLIEPTSGEISLDGEDILALDKKGLQHLRRHKMSMVFQRFGLFPHRTVLENVAFGLEIRGLDSAERRKVARHWLETVGLTGWEDSYPVQLSGGMQQRVGLARALTNDPEILLMDEPFSALDPLIRRSMQEELLNLQARLRKTIIFITHDLDEALHLGDRIAILKDGKVDQVGTPEDILTAPATPYVAEFTQDVNRSRALRAASVMIQPRALALDHSGPRRALKLMDEQGVSSAYVVDRQRRFVGVASLEDVVSAARKGQKDLHDIVLAQVPSVTPDTVLQEILPIAASTSLPLAVVNEEGVLIGIIPRVRILSALAGEREEESPRQLSAGSAGDAETRDAQKAPDLAEVAHPLGGNSRERN